MTVAGDDSLDFPDYEAAQLRRNHLPGFQWWRAAQPSPRNRMRLPLGRARVGLVSTAGAHPAGTPQLGTHGRTALLPLDAPVELTHPGYDTATVSADPEVVLPRRTLLDLAGDGVVGAVCETALSVMGGALKAERIIERSAPAAVAWAGAEAADLVVLIPACPVCQQSAGLIQRALDEAGVPTVSITQVPSITEMVRPSLACFVAHPFGYTLGPLHDRATQRAVLAAVLAEAERDWPAGTIVPLPFRWTVDDMRERQLGHVPDQPQRSAVDRLDAVRAAVTGFSARTPREHDSRQRFLAELQRLRDPFDQNADPVHVTGSAIVVGRRGTVLHMHKRLHRWMQPGGHLDPGEWPADAALRETVEETGLAVQHPQGGARLVHLDVHPAARGHVHLDLRYLLEAPDEDPLPAPGESPQARWFGWDEALAVADEALVDGLRRVRGAG